MVNLDHLLLLLLKYYLLRFEVTQTLCDIAIDLITHFKVLVEHAEKLEFQTAIKDLGHFCS